MFHVPLARLGAIDRAGQALTSLSHVAQAKVRGAGRGVGGFDRLRRSQRLGGDLSGETLIFVHVGSKRSVGSCALLLVGRGWPKALDSM